MLSRCIGLFKSFREQRCAKPSSIAAALHRQINRISGVNHIDHVYCGKTPALQLRHVQQLLHRLSESRAQLPSTTPNRLIAVVHAELPGGPCHLDPVPALHCCAHVAASVCPAAAAVAQPPVGRHAARPSKRQRSLFWE